MPPDHYISVKAERIERFVLDVALKLRMPEEQACLLAKMLTANDLRGVHSHGTRQIARYAQQLMARRLNLQPTPQVIRESPVSLVLDGDGGLGYFAAHVATKHGIAKAREAGVSVVTTRNHGHIGAAGIYARMTLAHDLLCFVAGGSRPVLAPGMPVYSSAIGSPMCFSAPAGDSAPLIVDFSPVYDLRSSPHRRDLETWIPGTILRCIGLGNIAQAWGGILAGVPQESTAPEASYADADQSAVITMFRIDLFLDPTEFRKQMDVLAGRIAGLAPLPGFEAAEFAGGPEHERTRRYSVEGIPISDDHRQDLEQLAHVMDVSVPWRIAGR